MKSSQRCAAVYTDGSFRSGEMAWASLIINDDRYVIVGGFTDKSHGSVNRAELEAVVAALAFLKEPYQVFVFSDSMYVVKGLYSVACGGSAPDTTSTWNRVIQLLDRHNIAGVHKVDGHSGDLYNSIVDAYARQCLNDRVYSLKISGKLDDLLTVWVR